MNNDPFLFVIVSWMRDQSVIVIQLGRTMVVWMVTSWYYHELDGTFFHSGVCSGKPDESRPSWPAWRCLQWSLSVSIYRVDLFHRQTSVNQTIEYKYYSFKRWAGFSSVPPAMIETPLRAWRKRRTALWHLLSRRGKRWEASIKSLWRLVGSHSWTSWVWRTLE